MPSNIIFRKDKEPEQPKNNLSDFVGRIVGHSVQNHLKQERNKSLRSEGLSENVVSLWDQLNDHQRNSAFDDRPGYSSYQQSYGQQQDQMNQQRSPQDYRTGSRSLDKQLFEQDRQAMINEQHEDRKREKEIIYKEQERQKLNQEKKLEQEYIESKSLQRQQQVLDDMAAHGLSGDFDYEGRWGGRINNTTPSGAKKSQQLAAAFLPEDATEADRKAIQPLLPNESDDQKSYNDKVEYLQKLLDRKKNVNKIKNDAEKNGVSPETMDKMEQEMQQNYQQEDQQNQVRQEQSKAREKIVNETLLGTIGRNIVASGANAVNSAIDLAILPYTIGEFIGIDYEKRRTQALRNILEKNPDLSEETRQSLMNDIKDKEENPSEYGTIIEQAKQEMRDLFPKNYLEPKKDTYESIIQNAGGALGMYLATAGGSGFYHVIGRGGSGALNAFNAGVKSAAGRVGETAIDAGVRGLKYAQGAFTTGAKRALKQKTSTFNSIFSGATTLLTKFAQGEIAAQGTKAAGGGEIAQLGARILAPAAIHILSPDNIQKQYKPVVEAGYKQADKMAEQLTGKLEKVNGSKFLDKIEEIGTTIRGDKNKKHYNENLNLLDNYFDLDKNIKVNKLAPLKKELNRWIYKEGLKELEPALIESHRLIDEVASRGGASKDWAELYRQNDKIVTAMVDIDHGTTFAKELMNGTSFRSIPRLAFTGLKALVGNESVHGAKALANLPKSDQTKLTAYAMQMFYAATNEQKHPLLIAAAKTGKLIEKAQGIEKDVAEANKKAKEIRSKKK